MGLAGLPAPPSGHTCLFPLSRIGPASLGGTPLQVLPVTSRRQAAVGVPFPYGGETRGCCPAGAPPRPSPRKELLFPCSRHTRACGRAPQISAEGTQSGEVWAQGGQSGGPRSRGWGSVTTGPSGWCAPGVRVRQGVWSQENQGLCASWKSPLGAASRLCSVLSPRTPTVTHPPPPPRPLGSPVAPGHRGLTEHRNARQGFSNTYLHTVALKEIKMHLMWSSLVAYVFRYCYVLKIT